jgi:hypothetical protein
VRGHWIIGISLRDVFVPRTGETEARYFPTAADACRLWRRRVDLGYRPDIIVERLVIIEVKTVAKILPVHQAQLLTYLRLSGIKVGLIINFHAVPFMSGIKRLIF